MGVINRKPFQAFQLFDEGIYYGVEDGRGQGVSLFDSSSQMNTHRGSFVFNGCS